MSTLALPRFAANVLRCARLAASLALLALPLRAGDWTNSGGNARRDGLSTEVGPDAPTIVWSGGRPSIIAWNPTIKDHRLFQIRQTGFPPGGEPNGSPVIAQSIFDGSELWRKDIVFNTGDWTTWIAGASLNRVYASRSGNGASVSEFVYALDENTGNILWTSQAQVDASPYDGVVFEPTSGDLLVASFQDIWRIRAIDGTTAWHASRVCSVSSNCGGAVFGNAIYVADAVPGGHTIKRFDLATGAFQYQGPTMPGFTLQNTPMVGRDGTIYLSRTQNNVATDFFYAFTDDGTQITEKWHVPAAWSTESEFAVGPDNTVYHLAPGYVIDRLDPASGATMNTSMPITSSGSAQVHVAIDALGRVFVSNGNFSDGTLYAFDQDLSFRWSVPVTNVNIGGPAFGPDGTLVVAGVGSDVRAYATTRFLPMCQESIAFPLQCPCGNHGADDHGCANSQPNSLGAILVGAGTTSPDTVVLTAAGMLPSTLHVYFQGDPLLQGHAYGDGMLCAGGHFVRLAKKHAVEGASTFPDASAGDPTITARCAALGFPILPGSTHVYQIEYRDPNPSFCPAPNGSTFNATNGVVINW
jgi:outer membrane protein assembly factor BamB